MATNRGEQSTTESDPESPSHCSSENDTQGLTNESQSPVESTGSNRQNSTSIDMSIEHEAAAIAEILRTTYNLHSHLVQSIVELYKYEIVIVCDDSGSMMTPVENTGKTRWEELCGIVKRILEISVMFDESGVDLYFLNGDKHLRVKNPADVDHAFTRKLRGYTPLVRVLRDIFQSRMARRGEDKKLLVFVATDGKPTDNIGEEMVQELEHLMRYTRNAETTYVSFLLCTDDSDCVDYLAQWDRTMTNVDVTDDYETELAKIRRCQEDENFVFTEDDYVMKALIGAIVPNVDRLNETKITTTQTTTNE